MTNRKKTQSSGSLEAIGAAPATLEDVIRKIDALQRAVATDRKTAAADRKLLMTALLELQGVVIKDFKRVFETMDRFNRNLSELNELAREHAKDLSRHENEIADVKESVAEHDERLRLLEEAERGK